MEKKSMMNLALQSSNKPQMQAVDFMQNCNPIITISLREVDASIGSIANLRGKKQPTLHHNHRISKVIYKQPIESYIPTLLRKKETKKQKQVEN